MNSVFKNEVYKRLHFIWLKLMPKGINTPSVSVKIHWNALWRLKMGRGLIFKRHPAHNAFNRSNLTLTLTLPLPLDARCGHPLTTKSKSLTNILHLIKSYDETSQSDFLYWWITQLMDLSTSPITPKKKLAWHGNSLCLANSPKIHKYSQSPITQINEIVIIMWCGVTTDVT